MTGGRCARTSRSKVICVSRISGRAAATDSHPPSCSKGGQSPPFGLAALALTPTWTGGRCARTSRSKVICVSRISGRAAATDSHPPSCSKGGQSPPFGLAALALTPTWTGGRCARTSRSKVICVSRISGRAAATDSHPPSCSKGGQSPPFGLAALALTPTWTGGRCARTSRSKVICVSRISGRAAATDSHPPSCSKGGQSAGCASGRQLR